MPGVDPASISSRETIASKVSGSSVTRGLWPSSLHRIDEPAIEVAIILNIPDQSACAMLALQRRAKYATFVVHVGRHRGQTMSHVITGGCQCGRVRHEVRGKLRDVIACHCVQCR